MSNSVVCVPLIIMSSVEKFCLQECSAGLWAPQLCVTFSNLISAVLVREPGCVFVLSADSFGSADLTRQVGNPQFGLVN